jgi:glycosyltransferase involved in cell wall biosynthesis
LKFWMKHYYHRMDFILPQSDFSKKYLFELGVNTPSEVVSNGVDLNVFKKETDPYVLGYLKRKYYIDTENDFNVVFLGRLSKEKCIETLIYATKLVSDKNLNIKCHIIGNGTMKDELINLARDLGLSKKVSFLGHIPRIDLIGILSLCDLYVHTSEIELEGMALLEAMACNLPILVSDSRTSASSQFVQNNGELFEHKNSLDLSNKIINLMNDKELCKRYGVNSLEVAKRYSFDENMDKLSNILSRGLSI